MRPPNGGSIVYSLMLYLKARSTLNFCPREESNNLTNSKEVNGNAVTLERRLLKGYSLMRSPRPFETHIDYICKKACAGIGTLRRIKPFVPLCTLVTLYRTLTEPHFHCCSPLWDTSGKQLKDKLQKIRNRAGRVITGASHGVRSVDVLNNLKPGASIQRLPSCIKS